MLTKKKRICTAVIMIFLLSACRKSYTCRCDGGALGNGKTIVIENKTKDQVKEECESYNSSAAFSYHNCRLK
jgi:hypothetical protein